jgi:hypothetical protein
MAWTVVQKNNVMNQLIDGGLSPYGAAGLTSRWAVIENPGGDPGIFGGYKGRAFGHAQWLEPRRSDMWNWALDNGLDASHENTQVAYALYELNSSESVAGSYLKSAQDPWTAAKGASMFERAEGFSWNTGTDNFTRRTADAVPGIMGDYNDAAALSELQEAGLFGFGDTGGTVPLDQVPEDYFADGPTQIATAIESGNPGAAGDAVREAGKVPKTNTKRSDEKYTVPEAINEQSEQLQYNTKAAIEAAAKNTAAGINAASGISTGFQSLMSNLFIRGALIMLGAIFILAGVYGLSMGNGGMVAAAAKVVK